MADEPAGTPVPQFSIASPSARRLADIRSLQHDFEHVGHACRWLAAYTDDVAEDLPEPETALLLRCVWGSAVISDGRGFGSSRAHVDPSQSRLEVPRSVLDALSEEQAAAHGELLAFRHRSVAHRVDESQQMRVVVALNPPPDEPGLLAVLPLMINRLTPFAADVNRYVALAEHLVTVLEELIQHEAANVVRVVTKDLPKAYRLAAEQSSERVRLPPGDRDVLAVIHDGQSRSWAIDHAVQRDTRSPSNRTLSSAICSCSRLASQSDSWPRPAAPESGSSARLRTLGGGRAGVTARRTLPPERCAPARDASIASHSIAQGSACDPCRSAGGVPWTIGADRLDPSRRASSGRSPSTTRSSLATPIPTARRSQLRRVRRQQLRG